MRRFAGWREKSWWIGYGVAVLGLAVVMIRVPGGLSVIARVGLWLLFTGVLGLTGYLKTRDWD